MLVTKASPLGLPRKPLLPLSASRKRALASLFSGLSGVSLRHLLLTGFCLLVTDLIKGLGSLGGLLPSPLLLPFFLPLRSLHTNYKCASQKYWPRCADVHEPGCWLWPRLSRSTAEQSPCLQGVGECGTAAGGYCVTPRRMRQISLRFLGKTAIVIFREESIHVLMQLQFSNY